jgi:manganese/zinc/iron transport system substrate-binding protein
VNSKGPIGFALLLITLIAPAIEGCGTRNAAQSNADGTINIVATTNLVADLVAQIGGDSVSVNAIMGPGIDPHLYKASAGDVSRMSGADVIFYSGLHLEGKMSEIFEQMNERGKKTVAVTDGIERSRLIESAVFGGNYDPHVWFDVSMWMEAAEYVAEQLAILDPSNAQYYSSRMKDYLVEMRTADQYVRDRAATLPENNRVLITSHDAFGYYGRAYGFDVRGLQGISTAAEAGAADVKNLVEFIADRNIPAIFMESSVSPKGIEAVREGVRARGASVVIGGSLFSDALGSPDTPEGSYVGMVRFNTDTIVDALSLQPKGTL